MIFGSNLYFMCPFQNAHAYVSAAFWVTMDAANNYLIKSKPNIVYAGISDDFVSQWYWTFWNDSKYISLCIFILFSFLHDVMMQVFQIFTQNEGQPIPCN